jgi:hypothetical protein
LLQPAEWGQAMRAVSSQYVPTGTQAFTEPEPTQC